MPCQMILAVIDQANDFTRRLPAFCSWLEIKGLVAISAIAFARAAGVGSVSKAAPPEISGKQDVLEQITGAPARKASKSGIPKPSYKDGKTKAVHCDKRSNFSSSEI